MKIISVLFMPVTWAIGFIWPLVAQSILALGMTESVTTAYLLGALVALPWGVMAQLRGSWLWVK